MTTTSFEKRVKRRITGRSHPLSAVCPPGLEAVCKAELLGMGLAEADLIQRRGGIEFEARPDLCMACNLNLRSPSRILMRIEQFKATSFEKLEKKMAAIDWELYLPPGSRPAFRVSARKSRLYHSDAIAERCERVVREGLSPGSKDPGQHMPSQTLHIRADQDLFTVSLDTSGDFLFKRGIKKAVSPAPLRENLAFAMLHWAGFTEADVLLDPMCGSGTFSLEAAMIAARMPPGLFRSFACETWPGFSDLTMAFLKKKARERIRQMEIPHIFASDTDENAIEAVSRNISQHNFNQSITVSRTDFFSLKPPELPQGRNGFLMLNPPYGKRLGQETSIRNFYREVGRKLSSDFKGWRVGILLPSKDLKSVLGLRLEFHALFHGGLDLHAGIGIL